MQYHTCDIIPDDIVAKHSEYDGNWSTFEGTEPVEANAQHEGGYFVVYDV